MYDQMTGVLRGVMQSVNSTVSAMEDMQSTSGKMVDTKAIKTAKQSIQQTEAAYNSLHKDIQSATEKQAKFNRQIQKGKNNAEGLASMIKRAVITLGGAMAVENLVKMTDQYTNIQARLNLINDGQQTIQELNEKIFASANRARGIYSDMSSVIGKLGITASKAFANNDEMIVFAELMTKSFKIAGATAQEQTSAMYQLTQAMAAGRLQGDEFRSIRENAPLLAQAIAEQMNVSMGELKELSSEGEITADIIKSALFNSAQEINKQFENMPITFAESVNKMRNYFVEEMAPTFKRISAWINSEQGTQAINSITVALSGIVGVLDSVVLFSINFANFIQNNWSIIEPIIWGIVTALGSYLIMTHGVSKAIMIAQKAQKLFNTVMAASPATKIVTILLAVIVVLVRLWKTNDEFAGRAMRTWNSILNFFDRIPASFWNLAGRMLTPFQRWAQETGEVYDTVVNGIIGGINSVLSLINKVTGSSFELQTKFNFENIADRALAYAGVQEDIAYQRAVQNAAAREQKVLNMLDHRAARREAEEQKVNENAGLEALMENILGISGDSNKKLGKISDSVDISNEDLKAMRELAEIQNIQNFVTLVPTVNVEAHSTDGGFDIDTIVTRITQSLETEIANSASAVIMG